MHDFSQWLQSAGGMDWTPILIAGILISLAIAVTCESVMAIFAALACACSLAGLPSYTLKSEIEQVWGLQEVSSECDRKNSCPALQRWGSRPKRIGP